MATNAIISAAKQSVREFPKSTDNTPPISDGRGDVFYAGFFKQADILPLWPYRICDVLVRMMRRSQHNTLVTGAADQLKHRVAYTPYEISSKKYANRIQQMLMEAEYGMGFEEFLSLVIEDYFWTNQGGFIEIIGRGKPDKPLAGMPTGLGYLDSCRMWPTGDPEYPWIYERDEPVTGSTYGGSSIKKHWQRMHKSRVARLVANPQGETRYYKRGVCYGFKIAATADIQIKMSKYQSEQLAGLPPTGIITVNGMTDVNFKAAVRQFLNDEEAEGAEVFKGLMHLASMNPQAPLDINIIPFSNMPEHFDYDSTMKNHVNLVALALGDDPQNIWPLTGQGLGTGTQSQILHSKGAMKTEAVLRTKIQRILNIDVLPKSAEFRWKFVDHEQDQQIAETAKRWFEVGEAMVALLPGDDTERRALASQLVASHVEAVGNVLLDEDGNVRLPSEDVKDEDENQPPPLPEGDQQLVDSENAPGGAAPTPNPNASEQMTTTDSENTVGKAWTDTEDEFVRNVADLIQGGQDKEVNRRRFGMVMRAQLRRLGQEAYKDGLADGGVAVDSLSEDDRASFNTILVEQSGYVSGLADVVYGDAVTLQNFEARAKMWANKSLRAFYQAGVLSADRNGMYEWRLGATEEHCKTCKALDGQIHRYSTYMKSGMKPGSENLACHGDNCDCKLKRKRGKNVRARGRLPKAA